MQEVVGRQIRIGSKVLIQGLTPVLCIWVAGCGGRKAGVVAVMGVEWPSVEGLAAGSAEAQEGQKEFAASSGLALEVENSVGMRFRVVPPGEFLRGSSAEEVGAFPNEQPVQAVTITKALYVGVTEVTQGQWAEVMGENPARFRAAGTNAPVETVSWDDAQAFVRRLCKREGVPEGTYRLPTEAEWEYACRAGTTTATCAGDIEILGERNAPVLDAIAWYGGNSGVGYEGYSAETWQETQFAFDDAGTHPVGAKHPNAWGLHDAIGNVWEWCEDWIALYPEEPATDPRGPETGPGRVARGGAWSSPARRCRAAMRGAGPADVRGYDMGLRVVREASAASTPR